MGRIHWLALAPMCAFGQQMAWETPALPHWLSLGFEERVRYETLDRRYGVDQTGDQQFPVRTRLRAEGGSGRLGFLVELQESSVALTDSGSIVASQHVHATPLLQANASLGFGKTFRVTGGRMSPDFGSRRLIARNIYRNTTNAFDGVLAEWKPGKWQTRAFVFSPAIYSGLRDEQVRVKGMLAGVFSVRQISASHRWEVYLYRFTDSKQSLAGSHRRLWTIGTRWFRDAQAGRADYEGEAVLQRGEASQLAKRSFLAHAQTGYTFRIPLQPRLAAMYDYASGDRDPNDGEDNGFDTLFGARRFEFCPTGIYSLVARSNLNSPGYRAAVQLGSRGDFSVTHRWLYLASSRDGWRGTALADASGRAGRDLGQQVELRLRAALWGPLGLEAGYVALAEGRFISSTLRRPAGTANYIHAGIEVKFRVSGKSARGM